MRQRYTHTKSVRQGQYQIRNRFSHKTRATSVSSNTPSNQVPFIGNDMDIHEYNDHDNLEFEDYNDNDEDNKESEYGEDNYENDKESEYGEDNYENDKESDYEEDNYENDKESDYAEDNYENDKESEYEKDNDYDDDENEYEEENNDDDINDPIVDAPLDCNQMPNINGTFAPYFENATSALLFCWMQKHNICKLINIIIIKK